MPVNPSWCNEINCSSLISKDTLGGSQCIGKLDHPQAHFGEFNQFQWCVFDKAVLSSQKLLINQYDIRLFFYLFGEALKSQGLTVPAAIVDNLPVAR